MRSHYYNSMCIVYASCWLKFNGRFAWRCGANYAIIIAQIDYFIIKTYIFAQDICSGIQSEHAFLSLSLLLLLALEFFSRSPRRTVRHSA